MIEATADNIKICNNPVLISVVIPCFNSADFAGRAIESVFRQTHSNWEIILVNNNSTDNTQQVLERYQQQNPGKIKIFQEQRKGAPAARNKGLREAKGEWIQFLDADDEILPDKLKGQYEIATETNPAVVASPYSIKGFRKNKPFQVVRQLESSDLWIGLIRSRLGITSANLWNKDILIRAGGWDENLVSSQEYDLMFRMIQLHPCIGFDKRNLTNVYVDSGVSVSRGSNRERGKAIIESRIGLRLRIKEYLKSNQLLIRNRLTYLDSFVYKQLFQAYRLYPDYASAKMAALKLKVPFRLKAEGIFFIFKKDLQRIFKLK